MRRFPHIAGLLFMFLAGCSLFAKKPFSPIKESHPPNLDAAAIQGILEGRHAPHPRLWASGEIILRGKQIRGKEFFNATLLFEEPDRLRLRGSRLLASTLFEFIMNGDKAALAFNHTKEWIEGTREDFEKHPDALLNLNPVILPSALMIQQRFLRMLAEGKFNRWQRARNQYIFVSEEDGGREAFRLNAGDLLVREAAFYGKDGRLKLRLTYKRYGMFLGETLPMEAEAYFVSAGVTAQVRIKEYKFPPEFKEAVFRTTPAEGFTRRPVGSLGGGR